MLEELRKLSKEIHRNVKEKGWDEDLGGAIDKIFNEVMEVSSAEDFPKAKDPHLPQFTNLTVELADVMIAVLLTAEEFNLPVIDALIEKAKFNKTRPWRK